MGICDYKSDIPDKRNKAIFIDRDGTIIVDKVQTHKIDDLEFFPDTIDVLKKFQKLGYLLIVLTNQNGIAEKKYNKETFHVFTAEMLNRLKQNSVVINAVYYSPHKSSENHYSYKPNPGMLYLAQDECNIDMDKSFFIGDKMTDIIAANNAGCKSILVTTGLYVDNNYKNEEKIDLYKPPIANSLEEAYKLIVNSGTN